MGAGCNGYLKRSIVRIFNGTLNQAMSPLRSCSMTHFRLLLAVPLLALAFLSSLARAQAPLCAVSCNGGEQTAGTGGSPIQAEASISNQRGLGGSGGAVAQSVGRSTNIEGSQSYTYPVPLFSIPGRGLNLSLA